MGAYSLNYANPKDKRLGLLGVLSWQCSLLFLTGVLAVMVPSPNKSSSRRLRRCGQTHVQLFVVNLLCVALHASRGLFRHVN
jgi:hypothetical protein